MRFDNSSSKSWLEISKSALTHNFTVLKRMAGKDVKIICVVKANAYGHGILQVAKILKARADMFAVDNLNEALILRKNGITKPILILGFLPEAAVNEAIKNNISFALYRPKTVNKIMLLKPKKKAKVHLKIETGFNRQGLKGKELQNLARLIKKAGKYVEVEGVFTHLASAGETKGRRFTLLQLGRFKAEASFLKTIFPKISLVHAAASAGSILFPQARFNAVRIGIALYGLRLAKKAKLVIRPVLAWKSVIAQIKRVEKGESVGYGRTWIAPEDKKIAIVPVGYSDGYDRGFSNNSRALIKKHFAPVIGRVAMNMLAVDVTAIPNVSIKDEVALIGKSGTKEISVDELAERISTINYEIVSRINPLLSRFIVK